MCGARLETRRELDRMVPEAVPEASVSVCSYWSPHAAIHAGMDEFKVDMTQPQPVARLSDDLEGAYLLIGWTGCY